MRNSLLSLLLLLSSVHLSGCGSPEKPPAAEPVHTPTPEPEEPAPPTSREVVHGVFELDGVSPTLDATDLQALDALIADKDVIALGETVHGINTFAEMRSRVIRYLIEEKGFRAVSFEGPWIAAEATRAWVEDGTGTLGDAAGGLTFLAWSNRPTLELLKWLREFNRQHPDDKVRFFGADPQQPGDEAGLIRRNLGTTLAAGLEACHCGAFDSDDACYADPGELAIASGESLLSAERMEQCLSVTGQLLQHLAENEASLRASLGAEQYLFTTMAVEGVAAFSQVIQQLYLGTAEGDARSHEARDSLWARNFLRLRQLRAPEAKTVVWAHNFHIMRRSDEALLLQGLDQPNHPAKTMGTWLNEAMGERYGPIALFAYRQNFNFSGDEVQSYPDRGGSNHGERLLFGMGRPYLYVDLRDNALFDPSASYSWSVPWEQYVVGTHFDALLYMEDTEPSEF